MSRDLRHYAQQTTFRVIVGGILAFIIIGIGLIYLIYGPGAAVMGLLCFVAGMVPLLIIFVIFALMEWVVKKSNED